jgi:hypothetical protein
LHSALFIEVNEAGIKYTVVRRRQRDAISNVVGTSRRPDWKDVGSVNEPELDAANGALLSISKEYLPQESSFPAKSANFGDYTPSLSG